MDYQTEEIEQSIENKKCVVMERDFLMINKKSEM